MSGFEFNTEEMMKSIILFTLGLLVAGNVQAKTIDKTIHKTFPAEFDTQLHLSHGDGDVEITPWDKDVVDVTVVYRASFSGIHSLHPNDFEVEFEQRGDKISIVGREPNILGVGISKVTEYTYTIMAPAYIELNTNGVDGHLRIQNWENTIHASVIDGDVTIDGTTAELVQAGSVDGDLMLSTITAEVNCKTVDGRIDLQDISSTMCRATTIDGDISIENAEGEFYLRTVDGDIEARHLAAAGLQAKTTDGTVTLDLLNVDEIQVRVNTADGNVRVRLQEGTSAILDIDSGDGRIRTDLSPVSDMNTDDGYFNGSINGGRGLIKIHCGDGNVDISER